MGSEILVLGSIILVGFIGHVLYEYTKFPESLLMIIIGLIVGPIFGLVDQSDFVDYSSIVVTITLVIVLLDAGIQLNIFDTLKTLGKALKFTLSVLFFSTAIVGSFIFLIGWEPLHALLMGVVSSGTTTIVAAFLLPRLSISEEVKQILIVESIINDLTLITAAVIIIQVIQINTLNLNLITSALVGPFTMAIIMGVIFTILWVNVLWKFYKGNLTYVFTLGMIFVLYSFVELIGGNGAIAVLVLSLCLGNIPAILQGILDGELSINFLKGYTMVLIADLTSLRSLKNRFDEILSKIKESQVDFAFFIRNFFFVYLGIIFDFEKMSLMLLGICLAILFFMFVSRYISVRILALNNPTFKKYAPIMTTMVARGFTATFVALLPSTKGVEIPQFKEITLIMVLLSTIVTILGSMIYERMLATKQ